MVLASILCMSAAQGAGFDIDLGQLIEISPRPGTVINADNAQQHRHLFDADFAKFLDGGFATVEVGEPLSFLPHPAFIHATRQYRGQPALAESPGTLTNYAQGRPFPPPGKTPEGKSGEKIAWNMRYAYLGDSGILPELRWQLRDWRSEKVEFEMLFEARSMRFMYRHVQPPMPFIESNPQDAFGAFLLTAVDAGS